MSRTKSDATPLYEGMFLMNPQAVGGELSASLDTVRQMLDKQEAEVLALSKWDDRKLAFPIRGQKRGAYLLALFRLDGKRIPGLERDCELSEEVLRVMVTRADHMGEAEIEQAINDAKVTQDETKLRAAGEGEGEGAGEGASESQPAAKSAPAAASEPAGEE